MFLIKKKYEILHKKLKKRFILTENYAKKMNLIFNRKNIIKEILSFLDYSRVLYEKKKLTAIQRFRLK